MKTYRGDSQVGVAGPDDTVIRPRLLSSVIWNLAGYLVPLLAAVIAAPVLIHRLGVERFGIIALAWAAIGYFSLFDLGLGRALTQLIAQRIGDADKEGVDSLAWTGIAVMLALGSLTGCVLYLLAGPAVQLFKVSPSLEAEAIGVVRLLALSVPLVVVTTGLRGLLEAMQRFDYVNMLRIPLGLMTYLGPLFALAFTDRITVLVGTLVLTRVAGTILHVFLCARAAPTLRETVRIDLRLTGILLRFGGWMTVTNIVSPVLVYVDRFVIGAILSLSAVAYYSVPFEVANRLLLIPYAIAGVLFPAFARGVGVGRDGTAHLYRRGMSLTIIATLPISMACLVFARVGLVAWVGPTFAVHSVGVLRFLAVGVLANSIGTIAFALVQGSGRPDLTAKLHIGELPVYIALLVWSVHTFGLEGAAAAWATRTTLDAIVLIAIAGQFAPGTNGTVLRFSLLSVPYLAAAWIAGTLGGTIMGIGAVAGLFGSLALIVWGCFLSMEDKDLLKRRVTLRGTRAHW